MPDFEYLRVLGDEIQVGDNFLVTSDNSDRFFYAFEISQIQGKEGFRAVYIGNDQRYLISKYRSYHVLRFV
jgi:hypothetical protein